MTKDLNLFKNSPGGKYVMYGLYVAITIAIIIVVIKIFKGFQEAANATGAAATDAIMASKMNIATDRVVVIRTTAQTLWDKHTHGYLSLDYLMHGRYDSDDFVTALNAMMSVSETVLLNQYYKQAGGDSLKDVMTTYNGFGIDPSAGIDPVNWSTIQTAL